MSASPASAYEVHVLFDGYSNLIDEGGMTANCTCTLIKGGQHKIIVDTMTAWDGDRIVEALATHNIACEDITYVVCTHGHSDHIGNNNLFKKAKHIVGFSVSEKYFYHDPQFEEGEDYIIDDFITVMPTPGHTLSCVSVIVKTKENQTVAVTGDLFEREEDLKDDFVWVNLGGSEDEILQRTNRNRILVLADSIVPGHGPMFKVTDSMKRDARQALADEDREDMIESRPVVRAIIDALDDDDVDVEEEEEDVLEAQIWY